jgi:fermentation-respiration switch protein FrsA (DUF1100 family)
MRWRSRPATARRSVTSVLLLALAGLVGLTLVVRLVEPHMAFFPFRGETRTPAEFGLAFEHVFLETSDGQTIHAWWMPADAPRAVVAYFHGNGGNLSLWNDILAGIRARQLSVFALDYRGYGRSSGQPSERGLYRDVDAALAWLDASEQAREAPLVYWGRSLGATMAAYAASRRAPAGVILEAGFPDARSVLLSVPPMWVLSWLSSYTFPTARWMQNVTAPVLMLHGDRDSVVPYRAGRRLYDRIDAPKQFVTIAGGDHNDAEPAQPEVYWNAVDAFIDGLARR